MRLTQIGIKKTSGMQKGKDASVWVLLMVPAGHTARHPLQHIYLQPKARGTGNTWEQQPPCPPLSLEERGLKVILKGRKKITTNGARRDQTEPCERRPGWEGRMGKALLWIKKSGV